MSNLVLRLLLKSLVCVLVLAGLGALMANAQSASFATVNGTVRDPQGAVVPNATVTARNVATGVERTATTTGSGLFSIPNLQPGTYDLRVNASGFTQQTSKNLVLQLGQTRDANFQLGLAGATTAIEVTSEAPLVETTKTEVSSSVNARDILQLPAYQGAGGVSNDYANLAVTAPGVKFDTSGLTGDLIGPGSMNNRGNLYNVDGANITDQLVSGRDSLGASVDEIQELQVLTNNYNAEYGQAGGLILNAITKSGSNALHGDFHYYFRGRNLTASNYFYNLGLLANPPANCPNQSGGVLTNVEGCPRAPFHRKEGGFTLGGPLIKDRTFWFASFENTRQGAPLTLTPPGGAVTIQQPTKDLIASFKVDHKINSANLLTVRYNVERTLQDNLIVQTGQSITPDSLVSSVVHNSGLNVGVVSTITPNLVNEARFYRHRVLSETPDKTTVPGQQHPTFYTGADFCCPQGGLQKRYQYIDNLSWTHGSHSWKTGVNVSYYPWNSLFPQFHFGQYGDFASATVPTTFTTAFGPGEVTSKDNIYGAYVQDTWKLTRKLTLNYGLRYDMEAGAFKGGKIKGPNGTCFQGNGIIPACSSDHNNWQPRFGFTYSPYDGGKTLIHGSFAEVTVLAFNNVVLDSLNFDGTTLNTVTIDNTTAAGQAVLAAFPKAPSPALLAPFAPALTGPFGRVRPISPNLKNPEMRMVNVGVEQQLGGNAVFEIQYIGQFGFGLFGERDVNYPAIIADPAHAGFFYFGARPNPLFTAVRTNENSRTSHYNGLLASINKRMSNHVQFQGSYTWSHALTSGEDFFGLSESADPRNIRAELGPAFNDIRHAANLGAVFDTGKLVNTHVVNWLTNDITLGVIGQFQSGRPYPVSTGTAGFSNARFFGAGNETQQRPNVLANGNIIATNIPSSSGLNLAVSQSGVAACQAAYPAQAGQCAALQTTFVAPAGASNSGARDAICAGIDPTDPTFAGLCTSKIVDFQLLSGNVGRDAGISPGFYQMDISLTKSFRFVPSHENFRLELRADFFNILNHGNLQGNNTNDVISALSLPSAIPGGSPASFFSCTGCINPVSGLYIGNGGRILNINDLRVGRVSPDLNNPVFGFPGAGGIGDPASAAIPRTIQLAVRVRF